MPKEPWIVIATRPNTEFQVERALREAGYRAFCPMARRLYKPHTGPQQAKMMPLFPGYLFAHDWIGWPKQTISGVIGLLRDPAGNEQSISDDDIFAIYRCQSTHDTPWRNHPNKANLKIGDRVSFEIVGSIEGQGIIEHLSPNGQAIVRSLILGRSAKFTVPQKSVDKIAEIV